MEPLRFAVIGAGNIGGVHARAIAEIPGACVAVVCNRGAARGRALAEAHSADWTPDYAEAVARPDVDVVTICTPSGAHAEVALAAIEAGKHVIVEKPIEVTLPRVDRILSAARDAGVKLTCIFQSRMRLGVGEVKRAIDTGRLGRLVMAEAAVKWHRPQRYYDDTPWRGTWALDGGGALMNQVIHTIDLLQWLAGPVTSAFGHVATLTHQMETEDTAVAVLRFASGALGVIQGATSAWPGDPARIELHGEAGTVILEEGRIVAWKLADAAPAEEARMLGLEPAAGSGSRDPMGIDPTFHRRQIADMVAAIRSDRPPLVAGEEARKSVEIICAIYHSARLGTPVTLPLDDTGG